MNKILGVSSMGAIGTVHALAAQQLLTSRSGWGFGYTSTNPDVLAGQWGNARPNNLGVAVPQTVDISRMSVYRSFDAMLDDPDVKLVVVSSPTGDHREKTVKALRKKKHVLVEKPIAPTHADARVMMDTAAAEQRFLFCGQILPWFSDFGYALSRIREAQKLGSASPWGKLRSVQLYRHVNFQNPTTLPENLDLTGGPIVDLFVHCAHFLSLAFGPPKFVRATGTVRDGVVTYGKMHFGYAGQQGEVPHIVSDCGAILHGTDGFRHGCALGFDGGTLTFGSDGPAPNFWSTETGCYEQVKIPAATALDAFTAQLGRALDVIEGKEKDPSALSAAAAANALAICYAAKESILKGGEPVAVAA